MMTLEDIPDLQTTSIQIGLEPNPDDPVMYGTPEKPVELGGRLSGFRFSGAEVAINYQQLTRSNLTEAMAPHTILVCPGLKNKHIANAVGFSESTTSDHLEAAFDILEIHSRRLVSGRLLGRKVLVPLSQGNTLSLTTAQINVLELLAANEGTLGAVAKASLRGESTIKTHLRNIHRANPGLNNASGIILAAYLGGQIGNFDFESAQRQEIPSNLIAEIHQE